MAITPPAVWRPTSTPRLVALMGRVLFELFPRLDACICCLVSLLEFRNGFLEFLGKIDSERPVYIVLLYVIANTIEEVRHLFRQLWLLLIAFSVLLCRLSLLLRCIILWLLLRCFLLLWSSCCLGLLLFTTLSRSLLTLVLLSSIVLIETAVLHESAYLNSHLFLKSCVCVNQNITVILID